MNQDAGYSYDEFKASLDDNGDTTHAAGHWQQQQLTHGQGGIFWRDLGPAGSCSSDYHQLANKFLDLIQFWVPKEVGGCCRLHLTTRDQPFAIFEGLLKKDQLCEYRKHCMGYDYLGDLEDKESWGPIGRVFTSGIPQTSPDVRLYLDKEHPLRDFAARCKNYRRVVYGFIPVFDHPNGNKPVAVLEYVSASFYYILFLGEVKKALEESSSDLRIDVIPSNNLPRKQHYYDADYAFREVFGFAIASVPELHLTQLWVGNNFTCMERSSFWAVGSRNANSCCYGDDTMQEFVDACQLHRAESNIWNIGHPLPRANSSLFFCRNISDLSILVYPLAHFAQRARFAFYFAVCLRNREDKRKSRVVEFFLQFDSRQDKNPFPILKFLLEIIDSKLEGYELSSGQSIASIEMPVEVSTKSKGPPDSMEQTVISRTVDWNVPTSIFTIREEYLRDYKLEMFLEYLDEEESDESEESEENEEGGVKSVWKKWDVKERKYGPLIFSSLETGCLLECPSLDTSLVSPFDEIQIKLLLRKIAFELQEYFYCLDDDDRGFLIQIWAVKQRNDKSYLVTKDHPFMLSNSTKGLWEYRKKSMDHEYLLNEGVNEDEVGPPGRVFRSNYPELTSNLHMYSTKEFPLRAYAVQCGLRSYMAFPIIMLNQKLNQNECVGVLEYIGFLALPVVSYIMETSFKESNLREIHILSKLWRKNSHDRKSVLFEVSEMKSLVEDIPQFGDVRLWVKCDQCDNENCVQLVMGGEMLDESDFYISHKVKTKTGIIGTLLASESKSCFFPNLCDFNITEEQEVLMAREARMNVCFAICLQSSYTGDDLYFFEFLLHQSCRTSENLRKFLSYLLPIMKEKLESFKLGEELVVEVHTFGNISDQFGSLEPQEPNIPPIRFKISKYGEEINGEQCNNDEVVHDDFNSTADSIECVQEKISSMHLNAAAAAIPSKKISLIHDAAAIHLDKYEIQNKRARSITIPDLNPHVGTTLKEVYDKTGVSRSTVKRVCRENGIPRWPSNPKHKGKDLYSFQTPESNDDVRSSKAQDLKSSRNKNPPSTRADFHDIPPFTNDPLHQPGLGGTNTGECSRSCTKLTEDDVVITRVTLKDDTIKFEINTSTKLEELKQKVADIFGTENGSFKLKYKDDRSDWISLLSDEVLRVAMKQMSRELDNHKLQLKRKRNVPLPSLIVRVEESGKDDQSIKKCHRRKKEVPEDSFIELTTARGAPSSGPSLGALFLEVLPEELRGCVQSTKNVQGDGHCGFRAVVDLLDLGEDNWGSVRGDLMKELSSFPQLYRDVFKRVHGDVFMEGDGVEHVMKVLNCFRKSAPPEHWFCLPEMGYLVASYYNVALVCFSKTMNVTYLPLRTTAVIDQNAKVICMAFINGNHFIQVHLYENAPLPPICELWRTYRSPKALNWETFLSSRFQSYAVSKPAEVGDTTTRPIQVPANSNDEDLRDP